MFGFFLAHRLQKCCMGGNHRDLQRRRLDTSQGSWNVRSGSFASFPRSTKGVRLRPPPDNGHTTAAFEARKASPRSVVTFTPDHRHPGAPTDTARSEVKLRRPA